MFFKRSRMESEIDSFKAMQDKGARVAKRDDSADEKEGVISEPSANRNAPKLIEQPIDERAAALVGGADGRQQSVIGADATWEGKLKTNGSSRIEGELSGEVEAGETVFIENGARVRANIRARRVIIGGDLEGHIVCREQLVVQRSGRLGGEVSTKTLVIEEGATVHSRIQMQRDDEPARAGVKQVSNLSSRQHPKATEAVEAATG
ncbi:MAG: bactofilin family protein [Chloroflexota bacterium]